MQALSDLTLVVPTRNEAANIETFLASVPSEVELIVVDNSDDDTVDIVRRRRPCRTSVLHCGESLTVARENGARAATSRWLLFADADVRFAASYFATLGEHLDGPGGSGLLFGPKLSADAYGGALPPPIDRAGRARAATNSCCKRLKHARIVGGVRRRRWV